MLTRLISIALLLSAFIAGASARPPEALAHATYVRSDPPSGGQLATPGRIRVIFTEDVDPSFSELQVLDGARRRVDNRDTTPAQGDKRSLTISVPTLPDGNYLISWKTLSAVDGHTARGAFPLAVGEGGTTDFAVFEEARANPLESALRSIAFLGTLSLAGFAAFVTLVILPALRGTESAPGILQMITAWERRYRRWALVIGLVTCLAMAGWLAQQVVSVADGAALGPSASRYLTGRTGLIWLGKIALILVLLESFWRAERLWIGTGALAISAGILVLNGLTSHAAALQRGAELAVAIDWLHQMAAGVWIGGIICLLLLVEGALTAKSGDRAQLLGRVVPRFSLVALVSVVIIILSGLFSTLVQVGGLQALGNVYGEALIVKIVVLLPMIALGALNLLVYKPRFIAGLAMRARNALESLVPLTRRFRLALLAELVLGIVILGATGVLTSVEPGKDIAARQPHPQELHGSADELPVTLRIEPGRVGPNQFAAVITEPDGRPAENVQRVQLRFAYLDQELGPGTRTMLPQGPGQFAVDGNDLSVAGRWQVDVAVRRLNREDSVASYRFDLGVASNDSGSAIPLPSFTSAYTPATLTLLILGLAAALWCYALSGLPRPQRRGYAMASMVVVMTSALVLARSVSFAPDLRSLRNPIAPSSGSLARGQEVYQSSGCVECHGVAGRGDGPLGRTLNPRPADFRVHMAAGHTDGELFDWISSGVPGTAMPQFREQLSEDDRWNVINYIRRFAEADAAAQAGS